MSAATLLDLVKIQLGLKNDAAMVRMLGTSSSIISKVRCGVIEVSAPLMVRIHEETGLPTKAIKAMIAAEKNDGEN